jgi:membrane protease YdiL (CAAX protease family)
MNGTRMNIIQDHIVMPVRRPFSWGVFLIILAGTVLGLIAVVPYSLSLGSAAAKTLSQHMPQELLIALQVLQNAVIYGVLAGLGLFLACRIGLGLPFIESWIRRQPIRSRFPRILVFSIAVGLLGGMIIIALDHWAFAPPLKTMLQNLNITSPKNPPAWQGLLASLEGGLTEEVLLRLFALTLLAWIGSLLSHDAQGRPTPAVLWIANVLTAVLFGLGHLPATAAAGLPLDMLVITRAIVLDAGLGERHGCALFLRYSAARAGHLVMWQSPALRLA